MKLWKFYRLHKKDWQKFQEVVQKGQKLVNSSFVVFFIQNSLDNCKFGISIPQKLVKRAVDRNLYKRQIQNSLILYLKKLNNGCQTDNNHSHYNIFIITRHIYLENDFPTNQKNLYQLLFLVHKSKTKFKN